ncbi:protein FAR1-related sequence 5 [Tanacetum coccineum]
MNQSEEIYLATSRFESNDDLLKSVRAFYYGKGYGLSIRDSKKDQYVTLQCDLSGVYQDKRSAGTKRKKSTWSRLTDCPFQIKGKKGSDGVWIFQVKNLSHNHDPSTDMSGHPSFCRLEPDDAKFRKDDLGNRSAISLLFEELEKGGFSHDILHNPEGYNMPLLDIIGVTCFNTSFYSGFVFLKKKDKDHYVWALSVFKKILGDSNQPSVIISDRELALMNAIKDEFPTITSLLCVWHIEKNVFSNCKGAWTEKYLHFGNRSSSRAEGAHAKLKLYLQVSTGSFQDVKKKICLAVEHEFNEIKVKLAIDSSSDGNNNFFMLLDELHSKYQMWPLSKQELATSMIAKLVNESDTYFEPVIRRPKGRSPKAKKKKGKTSTTRDPSKFELVESSHAQNPSSSMHVQQHNNLIDLNAYPECLDDFS